MEYLKKGQIGQDFSNPSQDQIEPIKAPYQFKFEASAAKLKTLQRSWANNNVFNWNEFFPDDVANVLHNYYFNKHKDDWDLVVHPDPYFDYGNVGEGNPLTEEGYYHMFLTKDDDPTLPYRLEFAREAIANDQFAYVYRRINDFHPYLRWFSSEKFIKIVENLTGFKNLEYIPEYSFVSCYEEGHYNGPHTDGDNGRVAMVYHLSKDWKPYYGGVFMKTEWGNEVVTKAVNPPFNTLTMFNVVGGAPHFVSEVVKGVKNKRIAFTAWYV